MICPNCGKENKDSYKFCTGCGMSLQDITVIETPADRHEGDEAFFDSMDFENEETMILQDEGGQEGDYSDYLDHDMDNSEYDAEGTEELQAADEFIDDFENEKTVILGAEDDFKDEDAEEYNKLKREEALAHEYTTELRTEEAPDYEFDKSVPIYKAPPTQYEQDTEYISHLRALKQLMDDGIITEDEFVRKKQQILGI